MLSDESAAWRETGKASVIRVTCDLDDATNADLLAMIAEAETMPISAKRIVVDLSRCTSCNARAVDNFLRIHRRLGQAFFVVLPRHARCALTFRLLGIERLPFVVESLNHALHS